MDIHNLLRFQFGLEIFEVGWNYVLSGARHSFYVIWGVICVRLMFIVSLSLKCEIIVELVNLESGFYFGVNSWLIIIIIINTPTNTIIMKTL